MVGHENKNRIEDLIIKAFIPLCINCTHYTHCIYRKQTKKQIIQCELFEVQERSIEAKGRLKGLCINCAKAPDCDLHKEQSGVWGCADFE
jgi:hypothetical protein